MLFFPWKIGNWLLQMTWSHKRLLVLKSCLNLKLWSFKTCLIRCWKPGSAYGYLVQHSYELWLDLNIPSRNYVFKPWNLLCPPFGPASSWHPQVRCLPLCWWWSPICQVSLHHISPRLSQLSDSQAVFSWVILQPSSPIPAVQLLDPTYANVHSIFQIAFSFGFMIRTLWLEGPIGKKPPKN